MTTPQRTDAEQFLLGGGGKSAKFERLGDVVDGVIASEPRLTQQIDFDTQKPMFWDDGKPKEQVVITLQTDLREDEDDDGLRNLYVKGSMKPEDKSMRYAIAAAVGAAKAGSIEVGARLAVRFVGERPTRGNPAKQYEARYMPPAQQFMQQAAQAGYTAQSAAPAQQGNVSPLRAPGATPPAPAAPQPSPWGNAPAAEPAWGAPAQSPVDSEPPF